MFVVIFRARIARLDEDYARMAARLRELALREFGCVEFHAVTEGEEEVALSYWPDLAAITAWKRQAEHLLAQSHGRQRWYESYRVEIAEISRAYAWPEVRR
ncbi:antibiotic biosynthesis monooxygenase family protein [Acidocella sp.]|uniref:antibiotic biosynthesis monooxygenase family protein n=1 Tax=Acidocella sp. TaxID=50710 RepID=UPI003CFC4985